MAVRRGVRVVGDVGARVFSVSLLVGLRRWGFARAASPLPFALHTGHSHSLTIHDLAVLMNDHHHAHKPIHVLS